MPLTERLQALRLWMKNQSIDVFFASNLNRYLMDDPHGSFKWFTDFEGSNGEIIVTQKEAHFLTDSRYTNSLSPPLLNTYTVHDMSAQNSLKILSAFAKAPALGFPSQCIRGHFYQQLQKLSLTLRPLLENPLDDMFSTCDQASVNPLVVYENRYAGESVASKCQRLQTSLKNQGLDYFIYTSPEPLIWLLNIRSRDGGITPIPFIYGIVPQKGHIELYVEDINLQWNSEVEAHLHAHAVCQPQKGLKQRLLELGTSGAKLGMALESTNAFMISTIEVTDSKPIFTPDPITPFRIIKNSVEQEGVINAHIQDAVALVHFFAWLSQVSTPLSEIDLAHKLLELRQLSPLFWGESFETIAGFRENAAMPHYHPTITKSKPITGRGILLIDSGGQYFSGTTDVTRTVIMGGEPTDEEKRCYTLVLKGHIALESAIFPQGTDGCQLDVLARQALWQQGLDYRHATSHGVGHLACVHAPPYIGPRSSPQMPLQAGMVLSNEPAYYKKGDFGIRIENMMLIKHADICDEEGKPFLCFQTLTLVPLDQRLIATELLSESERHWVDTYHQKVLESVGPLCHNASVSTWLNAATAPLKGRQTATKR